MNSMCSRPPFLLISYSEDLVDGQPVYVCSNSAPIKAWRFEPAGHCFHSAALKLLGFEGDDDDEQEIRSDRKEARENGNGGYVASSYDSSNRNGRKKKCGRDGERDHYGLLGLGHLRYLASEEQIRKSYREVALKYHPDKQAAIVLAEETEAAREAKKEEIEARFKSIQEAYEILIDPAKRRTYDSTDELDDEIPTSCSPENFFKVFGPVFVRNGRWSINLPVPSLGHEASPMEEVDRFYDFWYNFRSWREFPHADEFDVEQAESRDHKRWMERQNAKLTEKARKEEYVRIRTLIDGAYKRDPRIARRKEEEKAEKQRKKEAKMMAKKMEEEEAARVAEEERRRREEEARRASEANLQQKKTREREKKLLRKERGRLRALSSPALPLPLSDLCEDDVETLCATSDFENLRNLCDSLQGKAPMDVAQLLRDACGERDGDLCGNGRSDSVGVSSPQYSGPEKNGRFRSSNSEREEKPWESAEIESLRKAVQKFPKGTCRRWEVISEFIGTRRSVDEILRATKTVLLQKPNSANAFDSFLEKRKPARAIASPLSTREETAAAEESAAAGGDKSGSPAVLEADAWSSVQERALIQALKSFPKEANQRWERVAAAVPGKTMNQCKKKFALLKETFRTKKNSAA